MEFLSTAQTWIMSNETLLSGLAALGALLAIALTPVIRAFRKGKEPPAAVVVEESAAEIDIGRLIAEKTYSHSIVVLPFSSISESGEIGMIADGLADELTTLLARIPSYFVVSRLSAFSYKDKHVDVRLVGKQLGVKYAVEGRIRQGGDRVRVTIQLSDTETGEQLWAENFERDVDDVMSLQTDLAQQIASYLGTEVTRAEVKRVRESGVTNLEAWQLYNKARSAFEVTGWSKESFNTSIELLRQAIKKDPTLARAHAYLALVIAMGHGLGYLDWGDSVSQEVLDAGETALKLDGSASDVLGYAGCAYCDLRMYDRGLPLIERGIELDPSNAQAMAALGTSLINSGKPEEGVKALKAALKLTPAYGGVAVWSAMLASGWLRLGNLAEAEKEARFALKHDPRLAITHILLTETLLLQGLEDEAADQMSEALRVDPELTFAKVKHVAGRWVAEHLQAAGLPGPLS
jgi:TolB-like protein